MANTDPVQGSPEHYKGQYAGLKFPPFRQQEYPKCLYRDEGRTQFLGMANNAMEEKELYASIGVEKSDIDPLGSAQDEIAVLKAKLAQYEGTDAKQQLASKVAGVKTNTVQMLPEDDGKSNPAAPTTPTTNVGQTNPLLKNQAQASALGTAPTKPGK